jgi:hypothetical protein
MIKIFAMSIRKNCQCRFRRWISERFDWWWDEYSELIVPNAVVTLDVPK